MISVASHEHNGDNGHLRDRSNITLIKNNVSY